MFKEWKESIPVVSSTKSIIFLFLNIFFPGLGTLLIGCCPCLPEQTFCAILQFLLALKLS